jgi:hypothetical protein
MDPSSVGRETLYAVDETLDSSSQVRVEVDADKYSHPCSFRN